MNKFLGEGREEDIPKSFAQDDMSQAAFEAKFQEIFQKVKSEV